MIIKSHRLSVEEFIERFAHLPDGGRWTELCSGEIHILEPPDDTHGNVIYHLSQSIAQSIQGQQESSDVPMGYACFDQGLIISRNPATVQFPPISYFVTDHLFETTDQIVTEKCPDLIIEVASTPSRRKNMEERIQNYVQLGTKVIWTIDTTEKNIAVCKQGASIQTFSEEETVKSPEFLPQLSVCVSDLFRNPEWYR